MELSPGLALLGALNPMRLGLILLMISRPWPVQNLLAYWVGSLTVSVAALLVPVMVVHFRAMLRSFAQGSDKPVTSSAVQHVQTGIGVVALSIAALTVGYLARQRPHPAPGSDTSTVLVDSNTPIAIPGLLNRKQDVTTEGRSAIRRLLGRAQNAWEDGSLSVAWVIGLGSVSNRRDSIRSRNHCRAECHDRHAGQHPANVKFAEGAGSF